jgi:hypothetical protein
VKVKRISETISEFIIYGQSSGQKRTVGLIARQGAGSSPIFKKQRDIMDVLDIGVIADRMRVIEMQGIVKMIAIGQYHGC